MFSDKNSLKTQKIYERIEHCNKHILLFLIIHNISSAIQLNHTKGNLERIPGQINRTRKVSI